MTVQFGVASFGGLTCGNFVLRGAKKPQAWKGLSYIARSPNASIGFSL
jgi:hypothetical protein